MTREEAKQLLPIIQAFAEGKAIEICSHGIWEDIHIENPYFDCGPSCYRIKPEPKYRPFKAKEECWKEMQNHQPFGWIKDKEGQYRHVMSVRDESDFAHWFAAYTFIDGTPFGINEE